MAESNNILLSGVITKDIELSHESYGEKFYKTEISVCRYSGAIDYIPIIISERLLHSDLLNKYVCVEGSVRTRNDNGHLIITVFVETMDILDLDSNEDRLDMNEVKINGYLCKKSDVRSTPFGRKICDIVIAVNRPYGRSDYIPSICWGRNADFVSTIDVGANLVVCGRMQSRMYLKNNEPCTAYELSVQSVNVLEQV